MGKVFTAGRNLDDLAKEMQEFQEKKIYSVADLSIEGIEKGPKEVCLYCQIFSIWTVILSKLLQS